MRRRRPDASRRSWRVTAAGVALGALCAYVTYWGGALIVAWGDLSRMARSEVPGEFLNPVTSFTSWEIVIVAAGAALGGALARYRWRLAGILAYVGLFSLIAGYAVYSVTVSIPRVPSDERWLSYVLLVAEGGGLILFFAFSFYSLDAATRRRWTRIPRPIPFDADHCPMVAFTVPAYNESVDMVEQTITRLLRQDYPRDRFLVVVADDSTEPQSRARLERFCTAAGARYVHRHDRHGFKAGALNHVIRGLPPQVELIAVVDADYWVVRDFLRSIVGYFADPRLGFVQTPQDYRNVDESFLARQYKRAEAYFYHAIMPSRNEENAIIFCGTMGILRRSALAQVGGFDERQICEDAELSVRIAAGGWNSLYLQRSFGRGIVPSVFESYQKQFYRWAFGNVKILLTRTFMILRSPMTRRQKYDFVASNLHWFDGFFILTISLVLMALGLAPVFGRELATHHQREIGLLVLIPMMLLMDSLLRLTLALRRTGSLRLRDAFLVQGLWFSIKMTTLKAVVRCLLGFRTPFIRTPKAPQERLTRRHAFSRAVLITKTETLLGTSLLGAGILNLAHGLTSGQETATLFLAAWLALFASFYLCAPVYAYLSYRTLRPVTFPPLAAPDPRAGRGTHTYAAVLHARPPAAPA